MSRMPVPLEQARQQSRFTFHELEEALHLGHGQHTGYAALGNRAANLHQPGKLKGQNLLVEKKQGDERLAVRRQRNLAFSREH